MSEIQFALAFFGIFGVIVFARVLMFSESIIPKMLLLGAVIAAVCYVAFTR